MRRIYEHQLVLAFKKMPKIFYMRWFWDKVNEKKPIVSEYKIRRFLKENCKKSSRLEYEKLKIS